MVETKKTKEHYDETNARTALQRLTSAAYSAVEILLRENDPDVVAQMVRIAGEYHPNTSHERIVEAVVQAGLTAYVKEKLGTGKR